MPIKFINKGNVTIYSCGCITEVIGKNFFVRPHSLDCKVYKYIIKRVKETNMRLDFIMDGDYR